MLPSPAEKRKRPPKAGGRGAQFYLLCASEQVDSSEANMFHHAD